MLKLFDVLDKMGEGTDCAFTQDGIRVIAHLDKSSMSVATLRLIVPGVVAALTLDNPQFDEWRKVV